jgi:hypothetical protein
MTALRQRSVGYSREALMDEENNLLVALDKGNRAKRLYETEDFKVVLEHLKDRVWADFKTAAEDDLLKIHADWRALERLNNYFRRQIEDADRAEMGLEVVREQMKKLTM